MFAVSSECERQHRNCEDTEGETDDRNDENSKTDW